MNVEIAQRLAELRRERGFSQEGLAEQLGLSRQAVSKWERAESAPDMGNLIALADLYEVTLDELLRVSPEVADDVRFESQERAESVETEAAAAAEASPQSPGACPPGSCPPGSIPPASSVPIAPPPTPQPKDPLQSFPYPLLCAVIFLLAGFCFGWWHPAWVIFLTIPFYYWVVNTLEADPSYQAWLAERQDVAAKSDSSSEGGAR